MLNLTPNTVTVLATLFGALVVGSLIRLVGTLVSRGSGQPSRIDSLATWWALAILFGGAVVIGKLGVVVLFAFASALGVREYFAVISKKMSWQPAQSWWCLAVAVTYAAIAFGATDACWGAIPLLIVLLVAVLRIAGGGINGFIHDVGVSSWGLLLLVSGLSHAALLLRLPTSINPAGGAMGWLIFLVVLTQVNDIAQALWGRRLGKHKVTPRLSPHKTWEGLVLGALTTIAVALVLGCLLTPLHDGPPLRMGDSALTIPALWSSVAGLLIAVGGFLGDLNMSAVKRDAGIKDSGTLLPGQGGILDRIDSLTFTAPLFYYYVRVLYG